MTKVRQIRVECPECSQSQETEAWESLNVTVDPDAKEELLAGKINLFRCRQCGYETHLDCPLLYHDMERQFQVWYVPFGSLEDEEVFKELTDDGRLAFELPNEAPFDLAKLVPEYMEHTHIVFDMDELVRYVIFRDKLYDIKHR